MDDTEQQIEFEQIETVANEARRRELELKELKAREAKEEEQAQEFEEAREIDHMNLLAAQQAAYQEAQRSSNVRLFSGPSLFKYAIILVMFAVPNDIIDALEFTGLGMLLSWFTSAFLSAVTILLTWFADSEFQRVKSHLANKAKYKRAIAAKLTKFAPKNPVVKIIAGAVLEMIPIASILPWSSISVFLAYGDERKAFKEAREAQGSEETSPLPETAPEMV